MGKNKHILVVDDHYEMQEFLSSMLKVGNPDYKVTCVPSAEEGQLELRLHPFDLLITDLRLPGMSGFDLVRRINKMRPDLPIIMISGTTDIDWDNETKELKILRNFFKPLSVNDVLETVEIALHGEKAKTNIVEKTQIHEPVSPDVTERLESLRTDTGAVKAVLARVDGQMLVNLGEDTGYDMPALIEIVAKNIGGSFQLARQLGTDESLAIQYQSGADFDVYSANVGNQFLIVLFFSANARRGRIGTIWIFAQRAIKDLLNLLERKPVSTPSPPAIKKPILAEKATQTPPKKDSPAPPFPQVEPTPPAPLFPEFNPLGGNELDDFWNVAGDGGNAGNSDLISFADAQKQGLIDLEQPPTEPEPTIDLPLDLGLGELDPNVDIEDFWSDAISGEDLNPTEGMSFAEAMKQGLISGDLGQE